MAKSKTKGRAAPRKLRSVPAGGPSRLHDERDRWDNLEEKLDQAITEVMFTDARSSGTPALVEVLSLFEKDKAPRRAAAAGDALAKLVGERPGDAGALPERTRWQVADELVELLRFVCHRGDSP